MLVDRPYAGRGSSGRTLRGLEFRNIGPHAREMRGHASAWFESVADHLAAEKLGAFVVLLHREGLCASFLRKMGHLLPQVEIRGGMFVLGAASFLHELEQCSPAIAASTKEAMQDVSLDLDFMRPGEAFLSSPSDSIDYAVMEKTDRAQVVPADFGWNDIGSWAAIWEDFLGNVGRLTDAHG